MKNLTLMSCCLWILVGCGFQYPLTAELDPQISTQSQTLFNNSTVSVDGQDLRKDRSVIVYKLKKGSEAKISTLTPPVALITDRLKEGLRGQGLFFDINSQALITVELNQLLATVTKPGILYNLNCGSHLTLHVSSGATTITKKYDRRNDSTSLQQPPVTEIESMLNEQLTDILNQILSDNEIRSLIAKTSGPQ